MEKKELTEVQKAWVADLRANPDIQGTGYLCQNGKFCCLGRAIEVFNRFHPDDPIIKTFLNDNNKKAVVYDDSMGILPPRVATWLGMKSFNGSYKDTSLTNDNDRGKTFLEIADIIEERAGELFTDVSV